MKSGDRVTISYGGEGTLLYETSPQCWLVETQQGREYVLERQLTVVGQASKPQPLATDTDTLDRLIRENERLRREIAEVERKHSKILEENQQLKKENEQLADSLSNAKDPSPIERVSLSRVKKAAADGCLGIVRRGRKFFLTLGKLCRAFNSLREIWELLKAGRWDLSELFSPELLVELPAEVPYTLPPNKPLPQFYKQTFPLVPEWLAKHQRVMPKVS